MTGELLCVKGVSKRYPGVQALDNVTLAIGPNEVVGLIGENGSGKSTLLKIMAGLVRPDEGVVLVRGRPLAPGFAAAAKAGIGMVFQEQSLILNVTVAENILMGCEGEAIRYGFYDWGRLRGLARRQLDKLRCDIAPDAIAGALSFARRQLVELAKCLVLEDSVGGQPIILLDEPTSVLDAADIDRVLAQIERLRARASIIFVSHRLDEVLRVCDRVYVMTSGRCVAECDAKEANPAHLQKLMLGQELMSEYRRDEASARIPGEVRLSVRNLHRPMSYQGISFDLRAGEIVGFAGVEGSGRESLCRTIYGAEAPTAGKVLVDGREVRFAGPADAVALGVGYVPSERRVEGIVSGMSVRENMTLAHLSVVRRAGLIDFRLERRLVQRWMNRLSIKAPSHGALAGQLSGGNQQKVVLAKCLIAERPRILILDHPLRGLDVGAKADIFGRVRELAASGIGVLLIADTLEELIALSDTILVMRDGRITARFEARARVPEPIEVLKHMI
jgi:ribose transport system ATP-binding protein